MGQTPIRYANLEARWVGGAARCERIAFPTANPDDLLSAEDFAAYVETFAAGAFVALEGELVVGVGAGIFVDFDLERLEHTFWEVTGEHGCANHDPAGAWYYGTDMIVLPDYRRRGIGRRLYELRKELVRDNNKRGIVAGGELPGFAQHKHALSAEQYVARVLAGELRDDTLTFQLNNGFEVRGVIDFYIEDAAIDNKAALIVWENPDFEPG